MKKIYILANKYPNIIEPNVCCFIQQLVWSFADLGYDCNVIVPSPVNLNLKYFRLKKKDIEKNENDEKIKIYRPRYISLGQSGKIFQKIRIKFTTWAYTKAVESILRKENDINNEETYLYAHFICPSGVAVSKLAVKYNLKSFMAHGEAVYAGEEKYGNKLLKKYFKNLKGVIAVSTQNKNYLIDAGIVDENKIEIFPNGYRKERFYKIDKQKARQKLGWDKDKFIVGFCGSFDERKGIFRLQQAIDKLDNVWFACAGKGKLAPTSEKCILKSPLKNQELLYFYNAIDIFVLPTRNEGCCNAIVEAIACGCPIISSDRSFNYDILNSKNSILIDPNNVEKIKEAIMLLKNNENLRKEFSEENLKIAQELTLNERAEKIVKFMDRM